MRKGRERGEKEEEKRMKIEIKNERRKGKEKRGKETRREKDGKEK